MEIGEQRCSPTFPSRFEPGQAGAATVLVQRREDDRRLGLAAAARRAKGLKETVTSRDPGDWIGDQIAHIRKKARGMAPTSS